MNRLRQLGALVLLASALTAFAQPGRPDSHSASSVSGQFVVSASSGFSRLARQPEIITNTALLRLEPMLVAVSAERIKSAVWKAIGLPPDEVWRGKIFIVLRPAESLTDAVTIHAQPFLQNWQYRVELPDLLPPQRFARTLAAVLLIEWAGRDTVASGRSAEIPAWLADGLGAQILSDDTASIILSAPTKTIGGLVQSRQVENQRGLDALAGARQILRQSSVLTFQQLSWPEPAQLAGGDGGAYFASAQLFTSELLQLKNGPARLRAMLAQLPACENWQTAFFAAFRDDFRRPLDVEKWWALRVVNFAGHDRGPRWTAAASGARLAELLSVPVELRPASNSLPVYAEISLQSAIQSLPPAQQEQVLRTKLRDLEVAELRFSPAYFPVVDGYRQALADYLGERKRTYSVTNKHGNQAMVRRASVAVTVKKLTALDARRRTIEAGINDRTRRLR